MIFKPLNDRWKQFLKETFSEHIYFIDNLDSLYCLTQTFSNDTHYHHQTNQPYSVQRSVICWMGLPNGNLFEVITKEVRFFNKKQDTEKTYHYREAFHQNEQGEYLDIHLEYPYILKQFQDFCLAMKLENLLSMKEAVKKRKI